jgi:acyl-CoA synthetase (AMP-forming)/AMP-acid ligase II
MDDFLTIYAGVQPDKVAVVDDRPGAGVHTLSYAQLEERANQLGHVLVAHGAAAGRKIVWCGQNSTGIVVMVNAARKVGATAVPLNYRLSDDEATYVTDHCDASIVFVDAEFAPLFERIRAHTPKVEHVLVFDGRPLAGMASADELMAAAPTTPPPAATGEDAGATMIYTSGTTGKPKGALRRATGDPSQVQAMLALIAYRPDDVYITTGPLYHSGPGGFMAIGLALGNTIVVQRKFDPVDWLRLVDAYKCTSTFSAPTPIRMICNVAAALKARYDRSSMRVMIANAAPWSFALKQQYVADFPPSSLWEVYGSTELGVNCILEPADQMRKPGSCGKPAPMVELRLYDDDGNVVEGTGPRRDG